MTKMFINKNVFVCEFNYEFKGWLGKKEEAVFLRMGGGGREGGREGWYPNAHYETEFFCWSFC